jgi:hypothetical protein
MSVLFKHNVGVAPGTTTMQLGRYWNPYQDMIALNDSFVAPPIQDRPIRWDLVGIIGGGSLIVALGAAFIASALSR